MRPRGSYGEVARALLAAAQCSPAPVRALAARACVGYDAARYTASRMVSVGALAVVEPGRPAVLGPGMGDAGPPAGEASAGEARDGAQAEQLRRLERAFCVRRLEPSSSDA